jgi:hypothetical protein
MLLPLIDIGGISHILFFVLVGIILVRWVSEKRSLPISARVFWIYALGSALYTIEWPAAHFGMYTPNFQATAGQAFVEILFIPLAASAFEVEIERVLPWAALFECFCVWVGWQGMLNAPSFNSAFAALAIPFCPIWVVAVILLTILTHHGTTALLIAGVIFGVRFMQVRKFAHWALFLVVVGILAFAAFKHSGHNFDADERLRHWQAYWRVWITKPWWIFVGSGPGSYILISCMQDSFKWQLFLQAHSDILQILWELGVVGLFLSIWTGLTAMWGVRKNRQLLSALCGVATFAITYHPLRFAPSALLVTWIFYKAFSCLEKSGAPDDSLSSEAPFIHH